MITTYGRSRARNLALRALDAVAGGAWRVVGLGRQEHTPLVALAPRRVLVARLDHIGDVILATPALHALRRRYPTAHITFLVGSWAKDVVDQNLDLDEIVCIDCPWWARARYGRARLGSRIHAWRELWRGVVRLRRQPADLFIDLRGDVRQIAIFGGLGGARHRHSYARTGGAFLLEEPLVCDESSHEIDKNLSLVAALGADVTDARVQLPIGPLERKRALSLLSASGLGAGERLVVIHPGAKAVNRWPTERFAQLIDRLLEDPTLHVVLTGSKSDAALAQTLTTVAPRRVSSLVGATEGVLALAAVIEQAALFVCADTGPMHLLNALDVPAVVLLGPTVPGRFAPRSEYVAVLREGSCCSDFLHERCLQQPKAPYSACMQRLAVEKVLEVARRQLQHGHPISQGTGSSSVGPARVAGVEEQ